MQDDGDARDQEVADLQGLVEQTRAEAVVVRDVSSQVRLHGTSARNRAGLAKQRELAAHQRAIELHEQAAELQERLGHPDRAANARQHAEHARQLLAKGLVGQREQESQSVPGWEGQAGWGSVRRPPGRPPPGDTLTPGPRRHGSPGSRSAQHGPVSLHPQPGAVPVADAEERDSTPPSRA
jgi:hypothetical protein